MFDRAETVADRSPESRRRRAGRSSLARLGAIAVLSFSVGLAQTPPAPTAPPAGPIGWPPKLELNQTWVITINGIGTWELKLTGRDTDGDPVGKAVAQTKDIKDQQAFFYFKRADDQAYLALTDGSITTLCTFDRGSVQGETMFGATFTRTKSDAGFKPIDNVCAASLDPLAQLGINLNPTPDTTPPVSPWVRLQSGQTWRVTIPGLREWNVALNGTDADGDPTGTATPVGGGSSLDAFFYYAPQERNAILQLSDGTTITACVFPAGSLAGSVMTGSVVRRADPNAAFELTNMACNAVLSSGPSAAPAATPSVATPPPSAAPTSPASPSSTASSNLAAWPPRIALGQVWMVDLGKTRYDLALTRLVNARPTGPATTGKIRADATFYFDPKTNRATLEIAGAATIQVCTFDAKSPKGAGYVGTAAYKTSQNGPLKPLDGACVATLLRLGGSGARTWLENTVLDGLF